MKESCFLSLSSPRSVREALEAAGVDTRSVLAVSAGDRLLEMNETLSGDQRVVPITLNDEEGRRIYERAVRFIMLLAVRRLMPGTRVRVEYSAGHGVFVYLEDRALSAGEIDAIAGEMRRITGEALPFRKKTFTREEAIRYFAADGQPDKVQLLRRRWHEHFTMYECGGMWEYFYGIMTDSTAATPVFSLIPHGGGFVIQLPSEASPDAPVPYIDRPKHLAVFAQSAEWCRILGVRNAADLADLAEQRRMRDFIRVNEALHAKALNAIADEIHQRRKRVILIAGPSSSGKTTFAARLCVQLRVLGYHPVQISLDNYYRNRDTLPRESDGTVDLEHIRTLDLDLMQRQINALLRGEAVEVPEFDFRTGCRCEKGTPLQLGDGEPIVIEGIHGLNPMLSEQLPPDKVHRIFVSALTCLNLDDHNRIRTTDVRLLRRIVRDHQFRGTAPRDTLAMWSSVRAGEERWIFPYQELADSMFNTALHYELPFLKQPVYGLLRAIPKNDPTRLAADRLLKMLNYMPDIDPALTDEIPPTSLLREFLGSSSFDRRG